MVGASKILTVSYGTFSCTLEGFEEPFSTMKAIAEYFRDLAADDRYFGAEPPTPDAQMLHQIAEREVQRRVEAKIQDNGNGVVLRADNASSPVAAEALRAPEPAADAPHEAPSEAHSHEEPAPEAVPSEAPAAMTAEDSFEEEAFEDQGETLPASQIPAVAAEDDNAAEDEPLTAPAAAPLAFDSVAAKLLRIRAAVEQARAGAAPVPAVAATVAAAPALAETGLRAPISPTPAAAPVEEVEEAAEIAEAPVQAAPEDLATPEDMPEEAAQDVALTDFGTETEIDEDAQAISLANVQAALRAHPVEANTAEAPTPVESEAPAEANEPETSEGTPGTTASGSSAAPAEPEPQAQPQAENENEPLARVRARVIKVRRLDPNAAPQIVPPEAEADDAIEEDIAEAPAAFEAAAQAEAVQPAEDSQPIEVLASEDEGELAADETASDAPEARPDADDAEGTAARALVEDEDDSAFAMLDAAAAVTSLAPDAEAELQAELAAVEREVDAHRRPDRGGRSILGDSADDDAMSRLMLQTENQLEGAESRRRLSTIAHLKAAVAAKEADRELGETPEANPDEAMRSYRDDLARVVRPRRPSVAEGGQSAARRPAAPSDRPAPLVLVSEQRIDRPAATLSANPIRPRRVSSSNLAVDHSDEDPIEMVNRDDSEALADSHSFAEFAERIGATSLPDLLEAAAAYSNCVEGLEHFTRPQIMRFAAAVGAETSAGDGFSREAGLRSFGALLRDGKIKKVKRGQFAISQSSRFILEARKIAR
jgi:hypothetical protein